MNSKVVSDKPTTNAVQMKLFIYNTVMKGGLIFLPNFS